MLAKLSFESLRVDIMLQLHDVEQLPLKHLQRFFQLTVLLGHLVEEALLVLAHHQVKVGLPRDLAEFELRVCLSRREKLTTFSGFFKYSRLDGFRQFSNLNILIPQLVLILSLLGNDSL